MLAESDVSGNVQREYVYYDGERIARRDADGSVYYFFADRLGSVAAMTDAQGFYEQIWQYYPFGGDRVAYDILNDPNTRWWVMNRMKFTGLWRDDETGLDHTLYRQYSSTFGRWYSPDPMAGDILNPQSLNRYAYVAVNPVNLTDPTGMIVEWRDSELEKKKGEVVARTRAQRRYENRIAKLLASKDEKERA